MVLSNFGDGVADDARVLISNKIEQAYRDTARETAAPRPSSTLASAGELDGIAAQSAESPEHSKVEQRTAETPLPTFQVQRLPYK